MKRLLSSLLLGAALLCLAACQDEADEPAAREPDVTEIPDSPFEALAVNDTLSLVETLRLQKPESIESAEIYLNDELLGSLETAPFEYELDTRAYEDGARMLRVEVSYAGDQQETFDFPVHFINTLATVSIPPGEPRYAEELYLVASGKEGEIFGITAIEGPGTYKVQAARKGFGATISLSLLGSFTAIEENLTFTDIRTVNGVPLQSQTEAYFFYAEFFDGEKGHASLAIPDLGEQQVFFCQEQGGVREVSRQDPDRFWLYADPSWLGVYKVENDEYFYSLHQLQPDDELVLPLAEIDQPLVQKKMSSDFYQAYRLRLVPDPALYPQTKLNLWPLERGNWPSTPLEHYLSPADTDLAFELSLSTYEGEYYVKGLMMYGKDPEPFVPNFTDIQSARLMSDGELRLKTSSPDYTYSLFDIFMEQDHLETYWLILSPPEMETFRLPDLSSIDSIAVFKDIPPAEQFELYETHVITYSEYPALLDFIKKGILPDAFVYLSPEQYQYVSLLEEPYEEGGRKKRRKNPKQLRRRPGFYTK